MGVLANAFRGSHAGNTSVCSLIILVPAYEVLKLWELEVTGMASAAAAGETHGFYLTSANGSGGTPTQVYWETENEEDSTPSGWELYYGYSSEPTLASRPRVQIPFQPFGGLGLWEGKGSPLVVHNKSASVIHVALRSVSGTSNIALRVRAELGA